MMQIQDFIFDKNSCQINLKKGKYCWSAPSNIALVKYWGKKDNQIPANPSLSFTLNNCKTNTSVAYTEKVQKGISFDFLFDGEPKVDFHPKITSFLNRILPYCSFIENIHLVIETTNTFPHSSGIASSASAMAALAMNIMSIENELNPQMSKDFFNKKASFLARLGSGSACRSISGNVIVWGEHPEFKDSSDLYGIEFDEQIASVFRDYCDVILLVDKGQKTVSSSVGHNLMHNHPFAQSRFEQAKSNLTALKSVLVSGDINEFIAIVESEALSLHAMMMSSMPYFILFKPNTLRIIEKIWHYREQTKIPVCFTLDAGANVHLLFPKNDQQKVTEWINLELKQFCQNGHYIEDEIGDGAKLLNQ